MRKFLIYLSIVLPVVLGGLALVNYLIDPGHIYSTRYIDEVIEGARRGLNATNVSNIDERIYKKKLIELYKGKSFDYLVLGSSRVLTISEDALNGKSLINLGVSGCTLQDMMAFFQICKKQSIHYKHVIIGVDPALFNANNDDSRWKSIAEYYASFIGEKNTERNYEPLANLFSPSYFKSAIDYLPKLFDDKNKIRYTKTVRNGGGTLRNAAEGGTRRPDGSIYYAKNFIEKPQTEVDKHAETYSHGSFKDFQSLSENQTDRFIQLLNAIRTEGADVTFFRCPYHPIFYKRIVRMQGVQESMAWIERYASENSIPLIASFNPADVGFHNTDFYDGVHVRKESIDRLIQIMR